MTRRFCRFEQIRKRGVLSIMLCSVGIGAIAQAQTADENPSRLRLSAGAEVSDTPFFFADADLLVARETRSQSLTFAANARIMTLSEDDSEYGIIDPSVRLDYAHETGPLNFNFGYTYALGDVDGQLVLDDPQGQITQDSFILSTGTVTQQTGTIGLEIGRRDPFGARLDLTYSDVSYDDVTDARLNDSTTQGADLSLRFDVTRVFQVNAGLRYSEDDQADALNTTQERTGASIGAVAQVNKVTRANAAISWTQIDTGTDDGAGGRTTVSEDGYGFDLGVSIDQRNGQWQLAYNREVDVGGSDDRLTLQRSFELTKTQTLSYTVGAIKQGDDISPLGRVTFQQELRNGVIALDASQDGFVTDEGARAISRRISGSYSTELTPRSSLSFAASLASLDYNDPAIDDGRSTQASVTYRHELTRDWDVSASILHEVSVEGAMEENDTALSLSLNRDLTLFR